MSPTTDRGWMPGVEYVQTPEGTYSGESWNPAVPNGSLEAIGIMNHIMQGYQATMVRWANGDPVVQKSAHFTIGRGGRIVQHVSLYDVAWSAGSANKPNWKLLPAGYTQSVNRLVINIEHEGFSVDPRDYPYDYLYSSADPWPDDMVAATIRVQAYICDELGFTPSFDTIIGHRNTDSVTRADDPGRAFPIGTIVQGVIAELNPQPEVNIPSAWLPDATTNPGITTTISFDPEPHDHDGDYVSLEAGESERQAGAKTENELAEHKDWHRSV